MAKLNLADLKPDALTELYNRTAAADVNDPLLKDIEAEQALRKSLTNRQAGAAQHVEFEAAKVQTAERERLHQEAVANALREIGLVEKAGAELQPLPPGIGAAYKAILEHYLTATQCVHAAFGNIDKPSMEHPLQMSLQNDLVAAGAPIRAFGFDAERPCVGEAVKRVCEDLRATIDQAEQQRVRKIAA